MKKKLLCLVLSLAMMAVFMPTMAFAADEQPVEVNVSTYAELTEALADPDVDVINVQQNITIGDTLNVGRKVDIKLMGKTLFGDGHQIFNLDNTAVVLLENGKLTGGVADNGGAIAVAEGVNLVLKDMVVTGNKANLGGGAIDLEGSLTLEGKVVIAGNTATVNNIKSDIAVKGKLAAGSMSKGSQVGLEVIAEGYPKEVINGLDAKYVPYFFADNSNLAIAHMYVDSYSKVNLAVDEALSAAHWNAYQEFNKLAAKYDDTALEGKVNAILKNAGYAIENGDLNSYEINAIVAKAKQKVAALTAVAGVVAGGDLVSKAAEKMFNDAKIIVEDVNSRVQAAVSTAKENIKEAVGYAMCETYRITNNTVEFVKCVIDNTYGELYDVVEKYATDTEEYSDAVQLIAENALIEVEKTKYNLARNTVVLNTALQQINIVLLAEDTAKDAREAGKNVLQGLQKFLNNLFPEPEYK